MAKLKPWYDVVELREDLRENRPLDASEFAIHLEWKWQSLPRFQQTRGVLCMLAPWVARNYQEEHRKATREPLTKLHAANTDRSPTDHLGQKC